MRMFRKVSASLLSQRAFGAGGGTRTHTGQGPTDFKSDMSTNSITPARATGLARCSGNDNPGKGWR